MAGNVYEWVEDAYQGNYENAPTDGSAQQSGSVRVERGGVFFNPAGHARSAYRRFSVPGNRVHGIGFRLVLRPSP